MVAKVSNKKQSRGCVKCKLSRLLGEKSHKFKQIFQNRNIENQFVRFEQICKISARKRTPIILTHSPQYVIG